MKKSYFLCATLALTTSCGPATRPDAQTTIHQIELTTGDDYHYSREWYQADANIDGEPQSVHIKGRGHSTFTRPKHPYVLRLGSPKAMAGLPQQKELMLLANIFDHSLMRNALALKVAQQTSLDAITPRGVFTNLIVNNKWEGLYFLCEGAHAMVTDSLIELDTHDADRSTLTLPEGTKDTLSFVDYYIVNELCMNAELNGPRSLYVHIDKDGTVHAGPVWDYDMAFNEVGVDDGGDIRPSKFKEMKELPAFVRGKKIRWLTTDSLYNNQAAIFAPLLRDALFRQQLAKRWKELRPKMESLTEFLDETNIAIRDNATRDQEMWNEGDPARFDNSKTYDESFAKLRATYKRRIEVLDQQFSLWEKEIR